MCECKGICGTTNDKIMRVVLVKAVGKIVWVDYVIFPPRRFCPLQLHYLYELQQII